MRLLFFLPDGHPTFRPDVNALFGVYLPREGIYSDIVTKSNADGNAQAPWGGGRAFLSSKLKTRGKSALGDMFNNLRAVRTIMDGSYDAIQVRDRIVTAVLAQAAAKQKGIPFVYWMSFPISESKLRLADNTSLREAGFFRWISWKLRGTIGIWLLYRWILPRSQFVFVQSDQMKMDVSLRGVRPDTMYAVPMGVDARRFLQFRQRENQELRGRRVIAYLGVCSRVRRIDFLLQVTAQLRTTYPEILLLLVGDGAEEQDRAWLRTTVIEMGLQNHVLITGWVSPASALNHMESAEVALAVMAPDPLLNSTSPTKLVEYMAMGLPIVANEHPEQKTLLEESGAGFCVPFSVNPFALAVVRLLEDGERAAEMGMRGRSYIGMRRTYDIIAAEIAPIYRNIVGGSCPT